MLFALRFTLTQLIMEDNSEGGVDDAARQKGGCI